MLSKYPGGKSKLAAFLDSKFPKESPHVYLEPLCGMAAVFFHLRRIGRLNQTPVQILADALIDVPQLFVGVRDQKDQIRLELGQLLDYLPKIGAEDFYTYLQGEWNKGERSVARQILLRAMSFNGLFRYSKAGNMNAPWNKEVNVSVPALDRLDEASVLLQGVGIFAGPFEAWSNQAANGRPIIGPGTWVFADPPYAGNGSYVAYTPDGFSEADQIRCVQTMCDWSELGAYVVYTNSEAAIPLVEKHWPKAVIERTSEARAINSDGDSRGPVGTIVVTSRR